MEKRGGVNLNNADIYLNVAGGLRITEPSADAAVCAALVSSLTDKSLGHEAVFIGEVGLSGEIRPVSHIGMRVAEALRLGAAKIYAPGDIPVRRGAERLAAAGDIGDIKKS